MSVTRECPICKDKTIQVKRRLAHLPYLHEDVWKHCDKCGHEIIFGVEKEPTNPPYWTGFEDHKKEFKQQIKDHAYRLVNSIKECDVCGNQMVVHKIKVKNDHEGIRVQLKCPKCFRVRYFTF